VDLEGLAKRYSAKSRDDWMSAVLGVSSERLGGLPAAVAAHTKERPASAQDWADLTALCLCAPEFQWR
jgi:hypothetical protein